ncbi:HNH endonuclease signature motif containing protein [Listeria monocytogenes]|uniref:HNH endonuclease signature motif containing protein n=1 Tax=Listeria monocytogenes TaxID=1639 RepID=UPI00210C4273
MCKEDGRLTPTDEVHHILPISQGGTHDRNNLMSLCKSCHNKIHLEIGDRQIRR